MDSHWRDCIGWKYDGFKFNTTSNEACKLYDALLSQYCGLYENQCLGGINGTITKMLEADPNFIMGRVIELGFSFIASPGNIRDEDRLKLDQLNALKLKCSNELSDLEHMHIDAINALSDRDTSTACSVWKIF